MKIINVYIKHKKTKI